MSPEHVQYFFVTDYLGNTMRSWSIPKPQPLKRESTMTLPLSPAEVNLPKLYQAISTQPNIELRGRLAQAKEKEKELKKMWEEGWRPSYNATKVLDAKINPYIR
jgi:hypothetical protein